MGRPTSAECNICGSEFEIAAKGRIPKRCPDCRHSAAVSQEQRIAYLERKQQEQRERIDRLMYQLTELEQRGTEERQKQLNEVMQSRTYGKGKRK